MAAEFKNDPAKLRDLAAYLKQQSDRWASRSGELRGDLARLGNHWRDLQFEDLNRSVKMMNGKFIEFQKEIQDWNEKLRLLADKADQYRNFKG